MPLMTFEPPVGPSPGTSYKPKLKILEAEFGDGYSQPTPDGINHMRRNVSLAWNALTMEQMHEIIGFFERHGGTCPFWFQPWGEPCTLKWTCREWDKKTVDGIWQVTAVLVEAFTGLE